MVALAAVAFLSAICMLAAPAYGGFTAVVSNPASTIGSGTAFLTAVNGSTQCTSVPSGSTVPPTATFPCTGSQFPAVPKTGRASATETLTQSGTASFASATYTAASCAPLALTNTANGTDPMLVRGSVAFAQPGGPLSGVALRVDGSTALASDVTSMAAPVTFSMAVWFKTSAGSGGLMGFSDSPNGAAVSNGDRFFSLDAAGHVLFSEGGNSAQSTSTYLDNAWHQAVVVSTVNGGGNRYTNTLYIDGGNPTTAKGGVTNYSGYWQIGLAGGPGAATYFAGSLAHAAVFPAALTAAQVAALYAPPVSESASVAAAGATEYWPLSDTGSTTFAGPYPVIGATSPCSHVAVSVGTTGRCVFPASASACATPPSSTLANLVSAGTLALSPGTQTVTTTMSEASGYVPFDVGLNLLVPVTITENGFSQTFTWSANTAVI